MLDNEQQPADNVDPSLPKPPAGRRSRPRPAGPPAEVVPAPAPAEVEPQSSIVQKSVPAEPEHVALPEPAAEDQVVEPVVAEEPVEELEEIEAAAEHAEVAVAGQPDDEVGPEGAQQPVSGQIPDGEQLEKIEAAAEHADVAAADQPDDEAEPEASAQEELADQGAQSESGNRRRRRRRGGRRRHTAGEAPSDESSEDESEQEGAESGAESGGRATKRAMGKRGDQAEAEVEEGAGREPDESEQDEEDGASGEESGASGASRRRRRRRRRRGEDTSTGAEDDPTDVVVKVRETHTAAEDKIHGVEGSTRLEAKRQRRREGRAAGRRRAPIVSEAEFLARREAVKRQMVLRQGDELSQIAVLEDGVLVEHYVDRESSSSLIGNIYLGRVQNVLPSMEAAFVDIGRGRNAVLYAGEVDWDAYGAANSDRKIEQVLKSGQQILVQVTKDPVGAKGARLTNHVSIPGRYVVYAPGGHLSGISRKLPDVERKRLKHILADLIEEGASVIVRTAAEGATQEQLVHDVNRLKSQWDAIEKKGKQGGAPQLLYSEPDLTIRTVRDLFTEDFAELIIDGNGGERDAYAVLVDYLEHVAPHLRERVSHWDRQAKGDVFSHYRLDEQIAKALERKVHLPSGGSLIIDRTEAMTVVDVNTGKFTGHGGNLEATVTANNLEAAEEIVRQLRLRDIGGIIVVDFIDMVLPSNRELLLRRLVECLGRDRTRHQVSEVTSLGLVQMTRKKIGTGLAEAFTEPCEHCNQRGYIVHEMPVATQAPSDGGDRQGRSNRQRNRGGKNAQLAVPSTPNGSDQASGHDDADKEQLTGEARAAAQAAISAVARAGSKPRTDAESAALLDDLVAALQEGDAAQETATEPAAVQDAAGAGGARQEEPAEAAPTRSRRSSRSRSRRSASAQAAEGAEDVGQQPELAVAGPEGEAIEVTEGAGQPAEEEAATAAPASRRRSSTRSTTKKAATKRSSTRKADAAPAVTEEPDAGPEAASEQPVEQSGPTESELPDTAPEEPVVSQEVAGEPEAAAERSVVPVEQPAEFVDAVEAQQAESEPVVEPGAATEPEPEMATDSEPEAASEPEPEMATEPEPEAASDPEQADESAEPVQDDVLDQPVGDEAEATSATSETEPTGLTEPVLSGQQTDEEVEKQPSV